ncbi:MAG: hypothetical protein AB7R55_13735, partial [Gemmatimonadales bacterium]
MTPRPLALRLIVRSLSYAIGFAAPLTAQNPAPGLRAREVARVIGALVADGPTLGPAIWPDYRPDSIPMLVRFGDDGA